MNDDGKPQMINVGCGSVCHPDWINLDLAPKRSDVRYCDLAARWPFDDGSIDVAYSSHVIEHLTREQADFLVSESYRVLKPGGIFRVATPDLEQICRLYLKRLDEASGSDLKSVFRYEYALLELFDQAVRDFSGGEMGRLLESGRIEDREYVLKRSGAIAIERIDSSAAAPPVPPRLVDEFRLRGLRGVLDRFKLSATETFLRILFGDEGVAWFKIGRFRSSGEVHRSMYDRFGLKRLLKKHGFKKVRRCEPAESRIADFAGYDLEIRDRVVRHPGSIFMEAVKPVEPLTA